MGGCPGPQPRKDSDESWAMTNAISLRDYDSLDTINAFVSSGLETCVFKQRLKQYLALVHRCHNHTRQEVDDTT